jgi:hypothetical protein
MTTYNPDNERIKHGYFACLKKAQRQSDATVDAVAKALDRFEVYTKHRDFKAFHSEKAIAFKRHLAGQKALQSGEQLSKATFIRDTDPTQEILPMACEGTWVQAASSVFRCRLFQPV